MSKKVELLKDLKEIMLFEEEFVEKISDFYRVMGWRKEVSIDNLGCIDKGLAILKEDSQKHKLLVQDLIKYVEGSNQDEF